MFAKEDMYRAYRKAKHEAFFDGTQPCLLEFVEYEQRLDDNLERLAAGLTSRDTPWYLRADLVEGHTFLPKSIESAPASEDVASATPTLVVSWTRRWTGSLSRASVASAKYF